MKSDTTNTQVITVAQVLQNRPLAPETFLLTVRAPELAALAEPGQFVKIRAWAAAADGGGPLLDRPFSIHQAGRDGLVSVLYRVVGPGTGRLSRVSAGGEIKLTGPFGRGLMTAMGQTPPSLYLAAGGAGLAPMAFAAGRLGIPYTLFYGERSGRAQVPESWLSGWAGPCLATTEDGAGYGRAGLLTAPLTEALKKEPRPVFACGPAPMLAAVSALGAQFSVPVWVSVEARMACGFGLCLTCSLPLKNGSRFRACREGPVYDGQAIDWGQIL